MVESTKVRLVRCPKCENLLQELPNFSVYQCGGCGAVLRAKNKNAEAVGTSKKSEGERVEGVSTKSQISSEKGTVVLSDVSGTDVRSNDGALKCDQRETEKNDVACAERCSGEAEVTYDKMAVENGHDLSGSKDQLSNAITRQNGDLNSQFGFASESQRLGRMSDLRAGGQEDMEGLRRIPRTVVEDVRFSTSKHPEEGPSNNCSDYSHRNLNDLDGGASRVLLEQDPADLLRMLDELKKQLIQSCDVAHSPKEKVTIDGRAVPPEPYACADSWFPSVSSGVDKASVPFFGPDKHAAGRPYFGNYQAPFPYAAGHDMPRHALYPPMHNPNLVPGYEDPFGSQIFRRTPKQLPGEYQQQPSHPFFSREFVDSNQDPFIPYQPNAVLHQPSSSCFHCYDKNQRVSAPVPPSAISNKRYPDVSGNPMLYHLENRRAFGSYHHNTLTVMPPLNAHGTQAHARCPSDINSGLGGFVPCRPQRAVVARGGHHCRPVAGGAPFLLCHSCFELIQLPRKVQLVAENEQKLCCGSCSTVISFTVVGKKLILRDHADTNGNSAVVHDNSSEVVKESTSDFQGHVSGIAANFSTDDYDNSAYDFQSMGRDPISLSAGQDLNSVNPQEFQSFGSSSPTSTSEDENSPNVLTASRKDINPVQMQVKPTLTPPLPGSPLLDHFDYSSNNHVVNRFGNGNQSSRSDQEKVVSNKITTRQNSLNEASLATEMEVLSKGYANSGIYQDSGDATREDYQSKTTKGSGSFFSNIIKKSFKDKLNVSVNGYPIPDRMVKKAEKMAGPIQPGKYWYDFRAGFWGVMGGPCLGIIPPFIEEFNYQMPENCAGGNTGVFVNGRELHKNDLDLLASRGLPTDRDRSYIIEISGRVLDEDTGKELDSLCKLAPTVEKVRHGFGMKVPRATA
ncbi:hypothetical protein SLEP1_g2296 [Rubroshorea leprosula]|uniref:Zinc-ribbon domain-containing protein n=1 Tax=Rubroshorea leprosula TaxID=152421 RepID=A0AAV5HQT1_9ROSI|nr:hypothetical protein SLEP1_g2296 [Rubroshorea leprosula]